VYDPPSSDHLLQAISASYREPYVQLLNASEVVIAIAVIHLDGLVVTLLSPWMQGTAWTAGAA